MTVIAPEIEKGVGCDFDSYLLVPDNTLDERIAAAKAKLGKDVVILGHHYQRDEVVKFADFRGDSLKLSQQAAEANGKYIVFCGVHFMAESADILRRDQQIVVLPDLSAGCSMADMADIGQVEACWRELGSVLDTSKIIPVTYMNSTAAIKSFTGEHGGSACTSSNAAAVMKWAFARGEKVLFLPDEHLGRNTGFPHGNSAGRNGGLGSVPGTGWQHGGSSAKSESDSMEGLLLRASAILAGARGSRAQRTSGDSRDRSPGVPV